MQAGVVIVMVPSDNDVQYLEECVHSAAEQEHSEAQTPRPAGALAVFGNCGVSAR